ncbi:MAG TPA: hypothetical protein VGA73_19220 [Candidatus Binatia bacterium]
MIFDATAPISYSTAGRSLEIEEICTGISSTGGWIDSTFIEISATETGETSIEISGILTFSTPGSGNRGRAGTPPFFDPRAPALEFPGPSPFG